MVNNIYIYNYDFCKLNVWVTNILTSLGCFKVLTNICMYHCLHYLQPYCPLLKKKCQTKWYIVCSFFKNMSLKRYLFIPMNNKVISMQIFLYMALDLYWIQEKTWPHTSCLSLCFLFVDKFVVCILSNLLSSLFVPFWYVKQYV